MYAEEVYSRIKNPEEMISIRLNQTQDDIDKYSKAKRRAAKRLKKRPFFSETTIILFMLAFFTSSCFLMMFYAPDVIDTVSIKLEEYTIIIDNYLPQGDENSSLIFQTITRDEAKAAAVGNTKTKEELDKQAEEEAYRLLQQADDERMQIAHSAMEKVNAKILLAIQQRERTIRQQRKESARLSRDKSFDQTIAREKKRLQDIQVQSKTGRKTRPRSIFINGQELRLDEDVPTPDNLRKDPHVHKKGENDMGKEKEKGDNGEKTKEVEVKVGDVVHDAKRDVDQTKREIIQGARKANGKLPIKLSLDQVENVEEELKVILPDAEQVKADSEYVVELGDVDEAIVPKEVLPEDKQGIMKDIVLKLVDRKIPHTAGEEEEVLARENENGETANVGDTEVDDVFIADLLKSNKEEEDLVINVDASVEENLKESASNVEAALEVADLQITDLQTADQGKDIDVAVETVESAELESEVSQDDYPEVEPTTPVEAAHDDDLLNILGDLQDLNQDIFEDKYV